ncbi:hypothetical protein LCGC14_0887430 [marine sediment metagenome]|uniref:CRISPR-associated endonuclease Cas1 n=1 Tax=marine sediment metagenome TaxID=412755 RepID=A0A0F9S749_9ZZZZ
MKETLYIMSSNIEILKSKGIIKCIRPDPDDLTKFKIQMIPISQLDSIETYGSIKLSTPLLKLCNKLKIPCYFNTYYGRPIGKFIPENSGPSIIRLKQYETFLNNENKLNIAKAIVIKATENRIGIISKYDKDHKLKSKVSKIIEYTRKISNVKSVAELRGFEGNIMKKYFDSFSILLNQLPFRGRSQRPPKDEGNAILSYGNVLLYNKVRSEVFKTGLDPKIGFLHEPHENRDSLSLDISEIFRPIIVDNLIILLDHKKNLLTSHFDKDEIKCYLNQQGKRIWLKQFKEILHSSIRYKPLNRNIAIQEEIKLECYNLIKFISNEKNEYKPLNFDNF